jgi:hypothetical protein
MHKHNTSRTATIIYESWLSYITSHAQRAESCIKACIQRKFTRDWGNARLDHSQVCMCNETD